MNVVTTGMMNVKQEKDEIQSLSCLSFPNKSQIRRLVAGGRNQILWGPYLNPFESCELKLVLRVDLKVDVNSHKFREKNNVNLTRQEEHETDGIIDEKTMGKVENKTERNLKTKLRKK